MLILLLHKMLSKMLLVQQTWRTARVPELYWIIFFVAFTRKEVYCWPLHIFENTLNKTRKKNLSALYELVYFQIQNCIYKKNNNRLAYTRRPEVELSAGSAEHSEGCSVYLNANNLYWAAPISQISLRTLSKGSFRFQYNF